jgi:hypothetical protein
MVGQEVKAAALVVKDNSLRREGSVEAIPDPLAMAVVLEVGGHYLFHRKDSRFRLPVLELFRVVREAAVPVL